MTLSKKRENKSVSQEHAMGCGVACVAARCGVSYQTALDFFERREFAWTRGYYCVEVVKALAKFGFKYAFKAYVPVKDVSLARVVGTIVFVEPCHAYPAGHYLVRTETGWMNPWSNFPQMVPVKASVQKKLAGKISYLVYEVR